VFSSVPIVGATVKITSWLPTHLSGPRRGNNAGERWMPCQLYASLHFTLRCNVQITPMQGWRSCRHETGSGREMEYPQIILSYTSWHVVTKPHFQGPPPQPCTLSHTLCFMHCGFPHPAASNNPRNRRTGPSDLTAAAMESGEIAGYGVLNSPLPHVHPKQQSTCRPVVPNLRSRPKSGSGGGGV
jgi:hypothetical protein